MKKEPLIFFFGVLFVSLFALFLHTLSNHKSSITYEEIYETIKSDVLRGDTIIDSIFLDYSFSMNEYKVNQHTNRLLKKGKLKKDDIGIYYDLYVDKKPQKTYLSVTYYDNHVHELLLILKSSESRHKTSFYDVAKIYEHIYGDESEHRNNYEQLYIKNENHGIHERFFIRGNLEIKVSINYLDEVYVKYTDLRVEQIKKNRAIEKEKKQQQDF